MSLSVNNSPFVKVDTSPLSGQLPTPLKVDMQPKPPTSHFNLNPASARNENSEVMVSATALTRVFDMLEQFFKSMREMLLDMLEKHPEIFDRPTRYPAGREEFLKQKEPNHG